MSSVIRFADLSNKFAPSALTTHYWSSLLFLACHGMALANHSYADGCISIFGMQTRADRGLAGRLLCHLT